MKYVHLILLGLVIFFQNACAQKVYVTDQNLPTENEIKRVEGFLASDALKGRKTFSPEIEKASDFIENEFEKIGLKPFFGTSFREPFFLYNIQTLSSSVFLNGSKVPDSLYFLLTTSEHVHYNSLDSFKVVTFPKNEAPGKKRKMILDYLRNNALKSNILLMLDSSMDGILKRLKTRNFPILNPNQKTVLLIRSDNKPKGFELRAENKIKKQALNNVVAVLPGTDKSSEYVIFSAHYDHLGTGYNSSAMRQPVAGKDSIFNGANDDASGTTAVIELANYFSKKHSNRRSLIFVCFTAEEIGEFGSQYFAENVDAEKIMAMFNIEMIGTSSKWGKDAAYITGFEKSDFGKILQGNLAGSNFHFYPDPYTAQNLFYRSDNAQLALKGVPAHTISTSKMDDEHNYHTPQDEIGTLDLSNMTRIIGAIALSSKGIVSGVDTPSRVDKQAN